MGDTRSSPGALIALACAAQFMVVLDVSVINVALPSLQQELSVAAIDLPWAVNAYTLVFAGFLLLGGRLADLHGHRRVFLAGLGLFTGASLLGGLAPTVALLGVARAGQGLGAAILAPVTLTLLTTTVTSGPARHRALAVWTGVGLAGGTAGNLLGGLLTEYLSWRSVLLINVPLGVIALAVAPRHLPPGRPARRRRLDAPGAVLATAGLTCLAYAMVQAPARGLTTAPTVTVAAAGVLALAVFLAVEVRAADTALVPARLLHARHIALGNLTMLLAGAALNPMWYFLALAMRDLLNFSPLQTGLGFLPHTVLTLAVGILVTPRLMRRMPARRLVVAGALVAAAGFAWQSRLAPDGGYLSGILGPAALIAAGGGLLTTPLTAIVTSRISPEDAGAASGLMNTAKQAGGGLGLAALVAIAAQPAGTGTGYRTAFLGISAVCVCVAAAASLLPRVVDGQQE
ncbi:drug resistance transporter, EmrB/QacA subfamily [Micromonospora halophytica]|uniref:Drug resistance transporter, EmrB/QacA subfamily n=1 Tax=Micromonospora halophytica TaxID=47864 RepID=A0A1C5ILX4_9ACTN|nr:drug resistance transporter, EmrB/QacA subfamily [Micromonospora halophytica]